MFMLSPIVPGLVAWIEKPTRCHSRVALLRGSVFLSSRDLIAGSSLKY
ncbi:hypothetical protein REIS_0697 [Rickettsia endosymbiont of Ixodes scapularis]|nr:hypothetical protein REIS_0697 [Rickettsia endosymbiont of Ixodes scapularis]